MCIYYILYYYYKGVTLYFQFINKIYMSKNFSFKLSPWTYFSKESDSLFYDQFIQNQILTFKTSHQSSKGVVKFKEVIFNNSGNYNMYQEVKIWFPIWNEGGNLFFKLANNYAKFIYQNGLRSYSGRLINFYGGVQSQKTFKNIVFKVGAKLIGVNSSIDSRLRIAMQQNQKVEVSSGLKYNYSNDDWTFDWCNIINFHSASFFYNSMRIIKRFTDQQIFFKAHNNKLRTIKNLDLTDSQTYFTNFAFDYIKKIDKLTKGGLQIQLTKKGINNISVVCQRKLEQKSKLKVKICSNKSIFFTFKSPLKNYGYWALGCSVRDIGHKNFSHLGLQIDLNL